MRTTLDEYLEACRVIVEKQLPVTVANLSEERGVEESAVRRFLSRNPEAGELLGFQTHAEALYAKYITAAALVRASDSEVSIAALARRLKWQPNRIRLYLKAHEDLARSIGWIGR